MNKLTCYSIRLCLCALSFFFLTSFKIGSDQTRLEGNYDRAVQTARHDLISKGVLRQGPDGYVYLKIPNKYVYKLFPLVQEPGFTLPGSIKRHTKTGAHISVMYKAEAAAAGPVQELGRTYAFEPKRIRHVRAGAKEYIILEVEAPELGKIRKRHGLSPKLMNHEFHVTLAEKRLK